MSSQAPRRWTLWIEGARPRTLVAALVPVVVGTAAAGKLVAWRFSCALVVAVALQVAVNYANDLFDGLRGVDQERRGPRRLTASGLASPRQMKVAVALALAVAGLAGLPLAAVVGSELLLVGAASVVAALAYSGGPRPYASLALGEVFVFVFFGLVATIGSAYVQVDGFVPEAIAAAVPVGLLATAILVVNNLRDAQADAAAGKITLAARLGSTRTRRLYRLLIALAFALLPLVATVAGSPWPLVAFAAVALVPAPVRKAGSTDPVDLVQALGLTARLHLGFGILLAGGLAI